MPAAGDPDAQRRCGRGIGAEQGRPDQGPALQQHDRQQQRHQRADRERQDQMRIELHAGQDQERGAEPGEARDAGQDHEPAMQEAGGAIVERQQARGRRIGGEQQASDQGPEQRHQRRRDIGQDEGPVRPGRRHEGGDQGDGHDRERPERQQIDQRPVERAPEPGAEAACIVTRLVAAVARETAPDRAAGQKAGAKDGQEAGHQRQRIGAGGDPVEGGRHLGGRHLAAGQDLGGPRPQIQGQLLEALPVGQQQEREAAPAMLCRRRRGDRGAGAVADDGVCPTAGSASPMSRTASARGRPPQ